MCSFKPIQSIIRDCENIRTLVRGRVSTEEQERLQEQKAGKGDTEQTITFTTHPIPASLKKPALQLAVQACQSSCDKRIDELLGAFFLVVSLMNSSFVAPNLIREDDMAVQRQPGPRSRRDHNLQVWHQNLWWSPMPLWIESMQVNKQQQQ